MITVSPIHGDMTVGGSATDAVATRAGGNKPLLSVVLSTTVLLAGGCWHWLDKLPSRRPPATFRPVQSPVPRATLDGMILPVTGDRPFAPYDNYRLRPGDQLLFTLNIPTRPVADSYRIRVGDTLRVEYLHEPAQQRRPIELRVKPDGTIDLPLIGNVRVAGVTVAQARRQILARARRYWKRPRIELTVVDPFQLAEELRKTFSVGSFFNQSLTLPVGPDGRIQLPLIGPVNAFGRTLPEVQQEVTARYREQIPGIEVAVHLSQRAPDRVYVIGEVRNPGVLEIDRPTTVIQAIAQAGSFLPSAELRDVILIRGYAEGTPQVAVLNLDRAIDREWRRGDVNLWDDTWLRDGDIIIVPKDHVQDVNDFVRRVISETFYGAFPATFWD